MTMVKKDKDKSLIAKSLLDGALNETLNFYDWLSTELNGEEEALNLIDRFNNMLENFHQDPQTVYDFVRDLYGGGPLTKQKFMGRIPVLLAPLFSIAEVDKDDDFEMDPEQLADFRNRRKSMRSITNPPETLEAIQSHRNSTPKRKKRQKKRKKLKPGQEHFPQEEIEGYEYVRWLGEGSYGKVCECRRLSDGEGVALKKVHDIFRNLIDARRFLREIKMLRLLGEHEAIVQLWTVLPPPNNDFVTFNHVYLVFEFVDTDLHRITKTNQFFEELHCKYIMYQVVLALKYMHSGQLVHRDLKPANVLIDSDCCTKVCDFGLSRGILESDHSPKPKTHLRKHDPLDAVREKNLKLNRDLTKHVVTRWYRAPEVILMSQNREYLPAIDMWSVGCIMAELFQMMESNCPDPMGRHALFPGRSCFPLTGQKDSYQDQMDQLNMIFDKIGTPTEESVQSCCDKNCLNYMLNVINRQKKTSINWRKKYPGCSPAALDILQQLLCFNYRNRLTAVEALEHPFFADVRDPNAEQRHDIVELDFEGQDVNIQTLRELIADEIFIWNPKLHPKDLERRTSSGNLITFSNPPSSSGLN